MSRNTREEVLRLIKTGLRGSSDTGQEEKKPIISPANNSEGIKQKIMETYKKIEVKKWGLINRFVEELTKVGGKAIAAKGRREAIELIIKLVDNYKAKCLAIWESHLLLGLRELIMSKGLQFASPNNKYEMIKADIGITEVDFAIAETGTIVLISNQRQPRSVSLIPPIHIAVMKSDVIVENLDDLFFLLRNYSELTSCITFVTGPSRTADIELNLTLGVHGPKELLVIIYP